MKGNWIRQDKGDGTKIKMTESQVKTRLNRYGIYIDLDLAMKIASQDMPLQSCFAIYYPMEVK
jgi:hypothetical protein